MSSLNARRVSKTRRTTGKRRAGLRIGGQRGHTRRCTPNADHERKPRRPIAGRILLPATGNGINAREQPHTCSLVECHQQAAVAIRKPCGAERASTDKSRTKTSPNGSSVDSGVSCFAPIREECQENSALKWSAQNRSVVRQNCPDNLQEVGKKTGNGGQRYGELQACYNTAQQLNCRLDQSLLSLQKRADLHARSDARQEWPRVRLKSRQPYLYINPPRRCLEAWKFIRDIVETNVS